MKTPKNMLKGTRKMGRSLLATTALAIGSLGQAQAAQDQLVYFFTDALGSPVAAFNEQGEICWSESYGPYGQKIDGEDATPEPTRGCGLLGTDVGYTGHVQDGSGLVYAQQRYYDPVIGRFMSTDPVRAHAGDPRYFGRYHYGGNNPYSFTDKNGESFIAVGFSRSVNLGGVTRTVTSQFGIDFSTGEFGFVDSVGHGTSLSDDAVEVETVGVLSSGDGFLTDMAGRSLDGSVDVEVTVPGVTPISVSPMFSRGLSIPCDATCSTRTSDFNINHYAFGFALNAISLGIPIDVNTGETTGNTSLTSFGEILNGLYDFIGGMFGTSGNGPSGARLILAEAGVQITQTIGS